MKRLIPILSLLLLCLSADAASIQWYSQQTATTNVLDTDIFAIEGPYRTGYKYITGADLKKIFGGGGGGTTGPKWSLVDTNLGVRIHTNIDGVMWLSGDYSSAAGTATNLLDPSNVRYWGADPTAATDSTTAFRLAINNATNGGTVFIPKGTYLISGGLFIGNRGRASMIGEGLDSIIQCTNQTSAVISITAGTGDFQYGQRFENFQIRGDGLPSSSQTNAGIMLGGQGGANGGVTGVSIRNVSIRNTGGPGLILVRESDINSFENITIYQPIGADSNNVPYLRLHSTANGNTFDKIILRNNYAGTDAKDGSLRLTVDASGNRPEKNIFRSISTEYLRIPEGGSLVSIKGSDNQFHGFTDWDSFTSQPNTTNTAVIRFEYDNVAGIPWGVSYGNIFDGTLPGATAHGNTNFAYGIILDSIHDRVTANAGRYSVPIRIMSDAASNYVTVTGISAPAGQMGLTSWIKNESGYTNTIIDWTLGSLVLPKIGLGLQNGDVAQTRLAVFTPFTTSDNTPLITAQNGGVNLGGLYGNKDDSSTAYGLRLKTYKAGVGLFDAVTISNAGAVDFATIARAPQFQINSPYVLNTPDPLFTAQVPGVGGVVLGGLYGMRESTNAAYGLTLKTYKEGVGLLDSLSISNNGNITIPGMVGIGSPAIVPNTSLSISAPFVLNTPDPLITAQSGAYTLGGLYGVRDDAGTAYGLTLNTYKLNTGPISAVKIDNAGNATVYGRTTSTNGYYLPNMTTPPAGDASGGLLWNSNKVLYWITNTKTNLVSDGR
jgi:hypothetical protein